MSLINQHTLTEESREARRRNGRQSRGAVTPEGKERSRAANLKHGIYSKERDEALRSLGEDPAMLMELIDGSYDQWQPANVQQASLVQRLAHLQWRMDRAARIQDRIAAEHIRGIEKAQRERAAAMRLRYAEMIDALGMLREQALRSDFYATLGYIQSYMNAFCEQMNETQQAILVLLHQLQEPADLPPAQVPLPDGAVDDDSWKEYLDRLDQQADEVEGLPLQDVAVAEGSERDELREELLGLAEQESQSLQIASNQFSQECEALPSQAQRDGAVLNLDQRLDRLRREEESNARLFCRLGAFLMKLQDRTDKRQSEIEEEHGTLRPQDPAGRPSGARPVENDYPNSNPEGIPASASGEQDGAQEGEETTVEKLKNAGASGDVVENTAEENFTSGTSVREPSQDSLPELVRHGAEVVSEGGLEGAPFE